MSKPIVSRSKTARASTGLGSMFGVAAAAPPIRSKSYRASTTQKATSRRPSVDHDAAMMSPPQTDTDAKMSSKAARVMGVKSSSRRTSTRDTRDKGRSRGEPFPAHDDAPIGHRSRKQSHRANHKAAVPDPYPIDDEQDLYDESPPPEIRPEPSRRKSKRDSAQQLEPLTAPPSADDPIIVDSMDVDAAPAEAERPRRERERERERPRRARGNSDAMGTLAGVAGTAAAVKGFKGMFGLGRKKAAPEEAPRERRRTAYETEDERKRRKRSTTRGGMTEDEAKRLRHERRSLRHGEDVMMSGANGGANGSTDYDAEKEARRAERRAKRDAEKGSRRAELEEAEAKAERRRERERENERATLAEKKARQMAELERRNQEAEEQLCRIAEKEERRKARGKAPVEDKDREHRSSRRKEKDRDAARPKSERRRSHQDEEADRRRRHEERRAARRNSEYPVPVPAEPITDYFDERNGATRSKHRSSRQAAREEENMPYLNNKSGDKTSSWVESLSNEPPLPPPISETVLDPAPGTREIPDDEETPSQDEDIRLRIAGRKGPKRDKERAERRKTEERERERDKTHKHSRRASEFVTAKTGDEDRERKRASRRATYAPAYEEAPVRTWDGRPAVEGTAATAKRGSWFKKIAGF
ncbi:hypothetical protein PtrV1_01161 [Pyrenophora tritici-repentis]|nr:hypothetical protein PtrV1_01161 [Pyrenophora tritici-repentis]